MSWRRKGAAGEAQSASSGAMASELVFRVGRKKGKCPITVEYLYMRINGAGC